LIAIDYLPRIFTFEMHRMTRFAPHVLLPLFAGLLTVPSQALQKPDAASLKVFRNAKIFTATQDKPILGTLVTREGKIEAVVEGDWADLPKGIEATDMQGATIIPGLVDTHSHIGIYPKPSVPAHADGNEMSGPVQPGLRAIDAIWPADPGIAMALAGGVTTANIMPGSGNVIGGATLYVKLRGDTVEAMRITGLLADGTEVLGGLKMANGENPKGYGRTKQAAPFTRMKVASLQREQFLKAKEYQAKKKAGKLEERDPAMEQLVEVLEKKRTVHFHCHRADDLMTALRISEEFQFELVLQHATEGYRVAEVLTKKKIPVSLTLVDSPGGKAETIGLIEENASILHNAGVPVCINTDDFITESRFYLRTGSIALRGGMTEAQALQALTITPAKVLHLDHRLGSLEKGKDADFVVLSGAPFSVYTKVLETWIDGQKRFDAKNPLQRAYRDGGFALPPGTEVPSVLKPVMLASKKPTKTDDATIVPGKPLAITAKRVHVGDGTILEDQVVVVDNGKITAISKVADAKIPAGAIRLNTAELSPGLIDSATVAGLSGAWNIAADQDQDEPSDPNQAELRVLDGFNTNEPLLDFLKSNGITTIHATPGRVNVLAGTTGVFRCEGRTAEDAAIKKIFAIWLNLGETPKDAFKGKFPGTRMGTAALIRKAFTEAQNYAVKKKGAMAPPENAKHEALLPALRGECYVIFNAHRADDIQTALRLADEFKLKPVISLGTEAYLLADELAKRKVPVIVHPTMQRPGGSMETLNTLLVNAAILKAKGVQVILGTSFEGYVPKMRNLRSEAAVAAANGMGVEAAMQMITGDAAKFLGIDATHGTVAVGKVADLVLYDGDAFENATHVTLTIMAGKVVFNRAEYLKLPYERRILPMLGGTGGVGCCLGF
jgi:imidazolonepropionase-like amidohydrolase